MGALSERIYDEGEGRAGELLALVRSELTRPPTPANARRFNTRMDALTDGWSPHDWSMVALFYAQALVEREAALLWTL